MQFGEFENNVYCLINVCLCKMTRLYFNMFQASEIHTKITKHGFFLLFWRRATHRPAARISSWKNHLSFSHGSAEMTALTSTSWYRRQSTTTILTEPPHSSTPQGVAPDITAPHNASFTKMLNTQKQMENLLLFLSALYRICLSLCLHEPQINVCV